jgi:hypothetical protein
MVDEMVGDLVFKNWEMYEGNCKSTIVLNDNFLNFLSFLNLENFSFQISQIFKI